MHTYIYQALVSCTEASMIPTITMEALQPKSELYEEVTEFKMRFSSLRLE